MRTTQPVLGRNFTRIAVALLLITASAKLLSRFAGEVGVLGLVDPLLGLSNGDTLLVVATIELGVLAGLLSRLPSAMKGLLAVWLGGNFLLYRLALTILQPGRPCKCLGTLTDRLPLDDRTAGLLLTLIALYLTAGGFWIYARQQRHCATGLPIRRTRPEQAKTPPL